MKKWAAIFFLLCTVAIFFVLAGSAILFLLFAGLLISLSFFLLSKSLSFLNQDKNVHLSEFRIRVRSDEEDRLFHLIKEIDSEHLLGKLEPSDHTTLKKKYRSDIIEEMKKKDSELAPYRVEAIQIVHEHLLSKGISSPSMPSSDTDAT